MNEKLHLIDLGIASVETRSPGGTRVRDSLNYLQFP